MNDLDKVKDIIVTIGVPAILGACIYIGKKLNALETVVKDIAYIKKELTPLVPAVIEIQNKFTANGHILAFPLTVAPGSPLKLTEYGDNVLRDFGFYEVFAANKDQLVSQVLDMDPKTNYDIQQDALEVIRQTFESNDPVFAPLKEYAFNNGLSIELVIPPAAIVLRDEVMKGLKF